MNGREREVRTGRSRALAPLLFATSWMVACEPTDEVVFRGPDAGTGGVIATGGVAGTGGVTGGAAGGGGTGGVATGGVPPATGGIQATGGVVATGGAGPGTVPCKSNADCERTETCDKASCGAEWGTCVLPPLFCDSHDPSPVCGCDRITYWNDCLRLQHGVAASEPRECGSDGIRCFDASNCRGVLDAACALFLPQITSCSQIPPPPPPGSPPGTCWVPPPTCAPSRSRQKWQQCSPFAPPKPCYDLCEALQEPGLYVAMTSGSCPPP